MRESRRNGNTKRLRKAKEALKEIIPAHRQVKGRLREYSGRTIVL